MRKELFSAQLLTTSYVNYAEAIRAQPGPLGVALLYVPSSSTSAEIRFDFGTANVDGSAPDVADATKWWTPATQAGVADNTISIAAAITGRVYIDLSKRSIGTTAGLTGWNGEVPQGFCYIRVAIKCTGTATSTALSVALHYAGNGVG